MGVVEDLSERGLGLALLVGVGVAAVSAGPKLIKAARPAIKTAMKGFITVRDRAKESVAEMGEQFQDLYAEAKHEMESSAPAMAESEKMQEEEQATRHPKMARGARHAAESQETAEQSV